MCRISRHLEMSTGLGIGNLFYVYMTAPQLVLVPCGGDRTSPRTLP